ncbi:hypothetical protein, partial [Segatella oulorum]|uniref:hypothetical protein n=1 Tax=Segatella oulorum TaxID=28136 RepID=UPI0023F1DAF9
TIGACQSTILISLTWNLTFASKVFCRIFERERIAAGNVFLLIVFGRMTSVGKKQCMTRHAVMGSAS